MSAAAAAARLVASAVTQTRSRAWTRSRGCCWAARPRAGAVPT